MTLAGVVTVTAAAALLPLFLALYALGRVREIHHGYYGLAVALLPFLPLWVRAVALVVGLDDVGQHLIQWRQFARGEPVTYRSPVHMLGHRLGLY